MKWLRWIAPAGAVATAACGGKSAEKAPPGTGGTTSMPMDSSGEMGMHMPSMAAMPVMRAHMDSMTRMSPGQMQGMMAQHDAMMAQMLDQMGSDMRSMHHWERAVERPHRLGEA